MALDAPAPPPRPRFDPAAVPRAEGAARLQVAPDEVGRTRLRRLYQRGALKCLLPGRPARMEAVLLNTAGGLTGGDRLSVEVRAEAGAELTVTSQAAERLYRAPPGSEAAVDIRLTADAGATLIWLPQETIVFDRAALRRRIEVELAADARLLLVEGLVLGRLAMGERVAEATLRDHWRIRRAGRLVFAEALRLSGDIAAATAGPATFAGHLAAATLLYAAPDAEARLQPLRAALGPAGGASLRDGLLIARLLAPDGAALRHRLVRAVDAILPDALPRVWSI
ncbi:MAG: urease accessory protein UreD [Pseudomonadota bacterium]